jgi:hypothetical protein
MHAETAEPERVHGQRPWFQSVMTNQSIEQSAIEKVSGSISDELLAAVGRRLEEAKLWRSEKR